MEVKLYSMSCEKNVVNKASHITLVDTLQGTLREECSLLTPSIVIEIPSTALYNINSFNYIYITEFNRYYYIKDVSSVRESLWRINLDIDVLYTYKDKILLHSALIDRQENTYNDMLVDDKVCVSSDYDFEVIEIDNSVFTDATSDESYLLTVCNA